MNLVKWIPTPIEIVRQMLKLAEASPEDFLYDLGSGDGRILTMAVKEFGVRKAFGCEFEKDIYDISQRKIRRLKLEDRICIINGDLLNADFCEASVITLYLSSRANQILRPRLQKYASPGSRIVSYLFPISGWRVAKTVNLRSLSFREGCFIGMRYLYLVPQAFEDSALTISNI